MRLKRRDKLRLGMISIQTVVNGGKGGSDWTLVQSANPTSASNFLKGFMAMVITYKTEIKLYIEKKHIGTIIEKNGGYAYLPKGNRKDDTGDVYASIEAVKATL